MIILGKKYLFNEMELVFMQKKSGNLSWLSFSQSNFATLKNSIDEIIAKHGPQRIVLNSRQNPTNELLAYLTRLELEGNSFITTEHFMESELNKCYIPEDNSDLNYLQNISAYTPFQYFQKRIVDYIGTIGLLLVSWPVMLYTAYRIKKESAGPVFFQQSRVGINGNVFQCIKFRSMHVDMDYDPYTRKDDPRIFPYGKFIRRTRIDELPQLFNVLKGDMHFVGPRAEWDILVKEYEKEIPFYQKRHLVRPGITGNAQVNYPYGQNLDDTRQKLMYDFYYIKHWSFLRDVKIIYKTIYIVLEKKGL